MAKKDLTITSDNNSVGSRSSKIREHEKALEVLEKAKQIPRKVVFVKQGEGEFSRELRKVESTEEMLNSNEAAAYLGINYHLFTVRQKKKHLPFEKKYGNRKYFKIPDLNRFKSHFNS